MDIRKLDAPQSWKPQKACPMRPNVKVLRLTPRFMPPSIVWSEEAKVFLALSIAAFTGLTLILIAIFLPPIPFHQIIEYSDAYGYSRSELFTVISIASGPLPFVLSILIGLAAAVLIPISTFHVGRHRLLTGVLFAFPTSAAILIDSISGAWVWINYSPFLENPPIVDYTLYVAWIFNPALWPMMFTGFLLSFGLSFIIIIMITSFFSEFIWNFIFHSSMTGPPSIRRTAIHLKGAYRGTVISVDHKGGYYRGYVRPSKWQVYERDGREPNIWAKTRGG